MNRAYQGLVVVLVAGICTGMNMGEDPCLKKNTTLKDPYRSTGYDLRDTDTAHCDNGMDLGWYTFVDLNDAPIQMPTVCPGTNNCGTKNPYWLNGNHPTENSVITEMTLCAKTSADPTSCCDVTKDIFVAKCNGFYLYYLHQVKDCPSGFCAGDMKRCPEGTWSNTDFAPCRDRFPILKTPPELKGPLVNGGQTLEFVCQVVYDRNEADAKFEVTWTFDGKPDPNINARVLAATERVASLNAQQLKNHFDQQVECQVRTYFVGREHDKSKLISSNPVFLGIEAQPELFGPNVRGGTFDFQCRVTFSTDNPDQQIEVFWTFDGKTDDAIKSVTLTGRQRSITLDGAALTSHINKNIGCQARLIFANKITTSFRKSKNYKFGITVNPPNVAIETSDNEKEVTITSTIPVVCDEGQNCCVTFKLKVDKKRVVSFKDTCEHKICSADWDPQKRSTSVKISLVPIRNQISSGTKIATVSIDILKSGTGRYINLFQNHNLPSVPVRVTIKGGYSCSATGDPHMIGFDYKHSYHFYTVGEYTAYTVHDRDFTVQVKTWRCWHVTCVCGVIVKEQNNIIRVYGCDKPGNIFASTVTIPYKLTEGVSVMRSQNGHHIGIMLPSGSEVKIDLHALYMNVYINTPAFDINKARGLCGTNDGNQNNDFTHPDGTVTPVCSQPGSCVPSPFIESWRVTGDKSLFVNIPPKTKIATTRNYCSCDSAQTSTTCTSGQHGGQTNSVCNGCHVITNMLKPDPWAFIPAVVTNSGKQWSSDDDLFEDKHNNERFRRSSDQELMLSDQAATDVDPNKQWPNSQGVTESQAIVLCNESISSAQLYTQCQDDNTMMANVMSDCLSDILFGETMETVDVIKSSLTTQCQRAMAKDEKNYDEIDGVAVMKKVFLDFVCPLECLKHGTCGSDGKCVCQSGWEGDACHIEVGKGPQISWTNKGSMCYAKQKICDSVNLVVSNVNILDELKCQVYTLDDKKSDTPVISVAAREGSPEAKCSLPQTGSSTLNFTISVTKDEKLYSDEIRINTFDATCLSCTDTGCVELKTACHIINVCYANGELNKKNAGLICDVSKHTSAWSAAPSNSGRTTVDILAVALIVLSTLNTLSSLFS